MDNIIKNTPSLQGVRDERCGHFPLLYKNYSLTGYFFKVVGSSTDIKHLAGQASLPLAMMKERDCKL